MSQLIGNGVHEPFPFIKPYRYISIFVYLCFEHSIPPLPRLMSHPMKYLMDPKNFTSNSCDSSFFRSLVRGSEFFTNMMSSTTIIICITSEPLLYMSSLGSVSVRLNPQLDRCVSSNEPHILPACFIPYMDFRSLHTQPESSCFPYDSVVCSMYISKSISPYRYALKISPP